MASKLRKGLHGAPLRACLCAALLFAPSWHLLAADEQTFCDDGRQRELRNRQAALDGFLERGLSQLQSRIDALPTAASESGHVKVRGGVVSVVLPGGRCLSAASGMADAERGIPMTIQHRFASGSAPKTMVAAMIVSEILAGRLKIDDPVAKLLGDEWWFKDLVNGARITVRQLLTHTAGLPDLQWDLLARSPDFRGAFVVGEPDFPTVLARSGYFLLPAEHQPGEQYKYSDTHYAILALLLEKLNGVRFEVQAHRMLYRLGMMFSEPDAMATMSGIAKGYLGDADVYGSTGVTGENAAITDDGVLKILMWNAHGGGWLISSPRDLARWAWIYFGGRLFEGEYVETLIEAGFDRGKKDEWYGLGVYYTEQSRLGARLKHSGFEWGYDTFMAYYPRLDLAITLQVNTNAPGNLTDWLGEEIAVQMAGTIDSSVRSSFDKR